MQLLDLFSLGYQVKNIVETLALVCAAKCTHDYNLAILRGVLAELDNLKQI